MTATTRILVTGAAGFLGSHIVTRARLAGCQVTAGHRIATEPGSVHLDVCAADSVISAIRSVLPSCVIHCANYGGKYDDQDLHKALAVNVLGSLRVLEAAARHGAERFVHLGTCFEYGHHPGHISEDAPLNPTAAYGATKAAATLLLLERARELGVHLIVIRPFGVWGPREPSYRLMPQVIRACLARSPLKLTSCEVLRDYTYAEDVAEIIVSLALLPSFPSGTILNVGSGNGVVLRDFVLSVAELLEGKALMHFGELRQRPTEMASLVADIQRLRAILGNRPTTSLSDGIRRTLVSMALPSSIQSTAQQGIT